MHLKQMYNCFFTLLLTLFCVPGPTFMGVNNGWQRLLQTEDNRDRGSDHVQPRGRGHGEFMAQMAFRELRILSRSWISFINNCSNGILSGHDILLSEDWFLLDA